MSVMYGYQWPERYFTGVTNERGLKDLEWHGCQLHAPGWNDPEARALAFTLGGFDGEADVHVMMNMYWEPLEFQVPRVTARQWLQVVDTAALPPQDIVAPGEELPLQRDHCTVQPRSIVVLISH